jgi:uracil DNA glycosylase
MGIDVRVLILVLHDICVPLRPTRHHILNSSRYWPPTLKSIAAEVYRHHELLTDSTLETWKFQGVSILPITDRRAAVRIVKAARNTVVIALGTRAAVIANTHADDSCTVLVTSHPLKPGFAGSGIFKRCNKYVEGEPIKWGDRK